MADNKTSLNDVLSTTEMDAVRRLIAAAEELAVAKVTLAQADTDFRACAEWLTDVYSEAIGGVRTGALPEKLVVTSGYDTWLVTVDVDGDHGHRVERVGGIYAS